ncbi:hypothetical protein XFF6166_490088 [Xanthomonas citri pv. fuscans]|nr:hypothetical protein XFF6166_490088 [Xanthomonas citri pv. fuscans]SOO00962.1 hypothetical protein XFF7767_1080094 [Xanthomonas citri pv. fuscans]SOO01265.1 hypothetical protein XFF6960_460088 [Xanthomonas citri pv. fuscans]SOO10779.1 hypothetical protein XFF6970_660001 [Xanthomonas citri pv. fuscans]SOO14349.1 hypothetical protein XFF7766_30089 [Xanthomonas citri pv. fuscans]
MRCERNSDRRTAPRSAPGRDQALPVKLHRARVRSYALLAGAGRRIPMARTDVDGTWCRMVRSETVLRVAII